jgi:hypothetical protein
MAPRTRTRILLRRAGLSAALAAFLVPAAAGTAAAAKPKKGKPPVINSISPRSLAVGQTLTIRGKNFVRGRGKNTVVFKRDGAAPVFVKADVGTAKLLKVTLPLKLDKVLLIRNGLPVTTRLRLRVLSKRLGRSFSGGARAPMVSPWRPPEPKIAKVDPNGDCDSDRQINSVDTDDDNDLLPDTLENSLKLDQCKVDTDGDVVEDGYEYRSAENLNDDEHQTPNDYAPFPGRKPYPNPLDGTDANRDHDGDALTLKEEFDLWKFTISQGAAHTLNPLTYSDGEQYSVNTHAGGNGVRMPALAAAGYDKAAQFVSWATSAGYLQVALIPLSGSTMRDPAAAEWFTARTLYDIRDLDRSGTLDPSLHEETYHDRNGNGWLNDAERDEDADGLSNVDETRMCMSRAYWDKLYDKETPYYIDSYAGTRLDDPDTDGDGIRDGADDQDHDDVPNLMECSRSAALGGIANDTKPLGTPRVLAVQGFMNPFNPCLPHWKSRACNRYPTLDSPWAPFNADDKYFYVLN